MREIKFRAWDKEKKKMLPVEEISFSRFPYISSYIYDRKKDMRILYEVEFENIELMQYTGRKDKNNKEIYEGYIMLTPGGQYLPVVLDDLIYGDGKFHAIDIKNCEIAGSIYENPELMEK